MLKLVVGFLFLSCIFSSSAHANLESFSAYIFGQLDQSQAYYHLDEDGAECVVDYQFKELLLDSKNNNFKLIFIVKQQLQEGTECGKEVFTCEVPLDKTASDVKPRLSQLTCGGVEFTVPKASAVNKN